MLIVSIYKYNTINQRYLYYSCRPDAFPGPLLSNNNATHGLLPCYDIYTAEQAMARDDEPPQARDEPSASEIDQMDAVDWEIVRGDGDSGESSNESTEWKANYSTKLAVEEDNHIYLTTAVDWELHRKKNVKKPFQDVTNFHDRMTPNQEKSAVSSNSLLIQDDTVDSSSRPTNSVSQEEQPDEYPLAVDWEITRKPRQKEMAFYNYGQKRPPAKFSNIPSKFHMI